MNIYWAVFKNLESEISKLMYDIHIDDNQLDVYSSKISDLILRSAVEIESISKELYLKNGGTKTGHIRYDDDALDHLIGLWLLNKKVVIISSPNCFLTNKTLMPFVKNEVRTGKTTNTFRWNNSYQNIKHDRVKSLKFGNIKYLFDILSALYILNLYYSNKTFPLKKDCQAVTISPSIGSDIFSIVISTFRGHNLIPDIAYIKDDSFDKCVYYVNHTEQTNKIFNDSIIALYAKINELAFQNPKSREYLCKVNNSNLKINWIFDTLGKDDFLNIVKQAYRHSPIADEQIDYEARLNKNEI